MQLDLFPQPKRAQVIVIGWAAEHLGSSRQVRPEFAIDDFCPLDRPERAPLGGARISGCDGSPVFFDHGYVGY